MSDINKRTQYVINKDFQLKFMLYSLIPLLISAGLMILAHFYFHQEQMALGAKMGLAPDHGYFLMIDHHDRILTRILGVAALIVALVILLWSAIVSHRIAGPLYRLTKFLKETKAGNMHDLSFRPDDFFQEIPVAFNEFLRNNNLKK